MYNSFELRQYDARMARWMSTDPNNQYHSPYLAMGNNPVSRVDPNGGIDFGCWLYYAGTAFMKSGSLTFFSKMSLSLISSTATKFLENTTIVGAGSRLPGGTGSTANTSQVSTNGGDPPGGGEKKSILKSESNDENDDFAALSAAMLLVVTPEPASTIAGGIAASIILIKIAHDNYVDWAQSKEKDDHMKGGKRKQRDKDYGIDDPVFEDWWHNGGGKGKGGKDYTPEDYQDWKDMGSPKGPRYKRPWKNK